MRYSGIGGQAVMEGVMMKNQDRYAVAVRKPDGEICAQTFDYPGLVKNKTLKNAPAGHSPNTPSSDVPTLENPASSTC